MPAFLLLETGAPDNLLLETGDNLLLDDGLAEGHVTQVQREIWTTGEVDSWLSRINREVWTSGVVPSWVTQVQREIWTSQQVPTYLTQIGREIWWRVPPPPPPEPCAPEYTEATEDPTIDVSSGSGELYFDYWTVGYDGLCGFPLCQTLLVTTNWARDAVISLREGASAFSDTYSDARLVDGTLTTAYRLSSRAGMVILDLGEPRTPDVFAVLSHNLYPNMVVAAIGSNSSDMSSPVVTAGFVARRPVAWVDLRGYTFAPARYWALDVPFRHGVRGMSIGELVVGAAVEFDGIIEPNFTIIPRRWEVGNVTEHGAVVVYRTGTAQRTCNLSMRVTTEDESRLRSVVRGIGENDRRMLVVPSSRTHEALWVESVPRFLRPVRNGREATLSLDLIEETLGAV